MLIPADAKLSFAIKGQCQVIWAKSCPCYEHWKNLLNSWGSRSCLNCHVSPALAVTDRLKDTMSRPRCADKEP